MTYATKLADESRSLCVLDEFDLDFCFSQYGLSPCAANSTDGVELAIDGTFDTAAADTAAFEAAYADWSVTGAALVSVAAGILSYDANSVHAARITIDMATAPGVLYIVTASAQYVSGDNGAIEIDGIYDFATHGSGHDGFIETSYTSLTTIQFSFFATSTTSTLVIRERGASDDAVFNVDYVYIQKAIPCYNTYPTCQDKANFAKTTKTYQKTSLNTAVPFPGPRPYLDKTTFLATEIKDKLSVKQRVKATFVDEPDTDIGIDPYVANRSSVQGTFWKKLLARNPNYKGRPFRQYQGFIGEPENEFEERFAGTIDNITLSKSKVTIEAVDLLSSLSDVTIAAEIEAELNADITTTSVSLTLTDTDELTESTGHIKLNDEIIYYTAKNDTTNTLTTELQYRGMFDTTAAAHSEGDSVQPVYYFVPDHPYDHMDTLLTLAEIDSRMNTTAFADYRDFPGTTVDFSAIIHEPTKASDLFWELVNFTNSVVWQDEAQQISIRKLLANEPGRSYGEINDTEHIVGGSSSADLNDKSRVTRVILYWDRTTLGDEDEVSSYQTIEIAIDADAESANEYNDVIEEKLFCRWLRHGYEQDELVEEYAELLVRRRLMAKRDAQEIVTFKLELKDEGLKTGDSIKLTTDTLSEIDGTDLTSQAFMVVKRDPGKGKSNELEYRVKRLPKRKICFIAPSSHPGFTSATDSEKEYGFIGNSVGEMSDGTDGYRNY